MKRSEILALWFLLERDTSHLETLSDYADQFSEVEKQFSAILQEPEASTEHP